MRATIERWCRGLVALAALTALAACAIGREPAYDAGLADEVTRLTAGTLRLFQELAPGSGATYEAREPRYRDLGAQAETVRLMAQARGSAIQPTGPIMRAARLSAGAALAEEISAEAAERLAEYRDATAAYMADYLRNLQRLREHDRGASGNQAGRMADYEAALEVHGARIAGYLEAFRLWQAGEGPQPEAPTAAPEPPRLGLDPTQVERRLIALEDILRDTLVYERDILNRNR
ncbi:MAG TPA: hypothetical protein VMM59_12475 [Thermohalobaculum sp.]|nr:hypothetical protein [Thermohalobaculum sp.]